jgi:hypothetical protein
MSFFDYRRGKTEHEAHTHLGIKRKQRKVLTLQSTEQQSGSCYSKQTIATEEEAYLKPILSGIMSSLLSITE